MAMAGTTPSTLEEVAIREVGAQDYLGKRFTSALDTVGRDVQDGFKQLYEQIAKVHSRPFGPPFLIASQPHGGFMEIEIGAPCAPVPQPAEGFHTGRLEGGRAAVALHRGAYDQMGGVYERVFAWIAAHGCRQAGAAREVYLNGPAGVKGPDDYLTEVVVPIA